MTRVEMKELCGNLIINIIGRTRSGKRISPNDDEVVRAYPFRASPFSAYLLRSIEIHVFYLLVLEDEGYFTLRDLKGSKLSGSFFNILCSSTSAITDSHYKYESTLYSAKNPTLTEWDRFAHREYIRLSMEEDASNGSADVWYESLEAPF
ncbi:hypothetical protein Tco_0301048 [Tanacetum coccineum]